MLCFILLGCMHLLIGLLSPFLESTCRDLVCCYEDARKDGTCHFLMLKYILTRKWLHHMGFTSLMKFKNQKVMQYLIVYLIFRETQSVYSLRSVQILVLSLLILQEGKMFNICI